MKLLVGYLLAVAVVVGGYLSAFNWLTAGPAPEAARKPQPVIAKAEAEPVQIVRDETVTFPDIPRLPAAVAALPETGSAAPAQAAGTDVSAPVASASALAEPAEPAKASPRKTTKKKTRPHYDIMILRTMQMPDGRIIQRLVPLRPDRSVDAYAEYR